MFCEAVARRCRCRRTVLQAALSPCIGERVWRARARPRRCPRAPRGVRYAAQADGASVFIRGEGLWFFEGEIYFPCTNGGPAGLGQLFRIVDYGDSGTLEFIAVSDGEGTLDFLDNITVSP